MDRKNSPSSRPLNGSMVTSTSCRYSVSASSSPAMKAPSAMERPVRAATRPAPMTISSEAAMNSSSLLALATERIIGRNSSRPNTTSATMPNAACAKVSSIFGEKISPPPWLPIIVRVIRIGATARSWNSSTEKVARPATLCWRLLSASRGMTMAVEDRARATPMARAACSGWPNHTATPAMAAEQTPTCSAPMPNTKRRMSRSRSQLSSSPIMNRRKTTPNSASWATSLGLSMVTAASHGTVPASAPSPYGPRITPAPRKPRIGLIRHRRNRGTTTPAVARNRTTSLYSPGETSAAMPPPDC